MGIEPTAVAFLERLRSEVFTSSCLHGDVAVYESTPPGIRWKWFKKKEKKKKKEGDVLGPVITRKSLKKLTQIFTKGKTCCALRKRMDNIKAWAVWLAERENHYQSTQKYHFTISERRRLSLDLYMEGLLLQGCGWRLASGPGGPAEFTYTDLYIFTMGGKPRRKGQGSSWLCSISLVSRNLGMKEHPGWEKHGHTWFSTRIYRSKENGYI